MFIRQAYCCGQLYTDRLQTYVTHNRLGKCLVNYLLFTTLGKGTWKQDPICTHDVNDARTEHLSNEYLPRTSLHNATDQ